MSKSPESALNTGDKDSSNISAWDSLAINSEAGVNKSDIISPQEIEVNPNTVTTQITAVAGVMEMYFKNKANKTTSSEIVDKIDNEYLAGEFAFETGEVLKDPEHVGINLNDITIELGNECNENIIVNEGTDNESQAGVNINPQEYSEFYRDVVSQLKVKHPTTKFNIAGVSGVDINWIRSVIEAVGDDSLIDNFSVHPYRDDVNGVVWGHSETNKTDIPYPIVKQQLIELANMHNIGFQCGEIAYGGGTTPEATELAHYRLDQDLKRSAANNVVAYIWPRTGLPF